MTTEILKQIERVRIKLRKTIHGFEQGKFNPFGAERHRFQLRTPLSISQIDAFEYQFKVRLPIDYRLFLNKIGNGGAGPAYGMFPLLSAVSHQRCETPADILEVPFPHKESFNPLKDSDSFGDELERKLDSGEITEAEFDRMLEYETAGTLVLCHEGCCHDTRCH